MRHAAIFFALSGLASILATAPVAGAWPRDHKAVFVSVEQSVQRREDGTLDSYTSGYAEYGLRPRLTLGAKLGMTGDRLGREALIFLRRPLGTGEGANRFAADLWVGARWRDGGDAEPVVASGLAWGRGYEAFGASGWMAVEGRYTRAPTAEADWIDVEATVGFNPDDRTHWIAQLRVRSDDGGTATTLAPSWVRRIRPGLKAQVGATWRGGDAATPGIFAATWLEF